MLNLAQIEILRRLIDHILQEKIEFATNSIVKNSDIKMSSPENNINTNITQKDHLEVAEVIELGENIKKITGYIKGERKKKLYLSISRMESMISINITSSVILNCVSSM